MFFNCRRPICSWCTITPDSTGGNSRGDRDKSRRTAENPYFSSGLQATKASSARGTKNQTKLLKNQRGCGTYRSVPWNELHVNE